MMVVVVLVVLVEVTGPHLLSTPLLSFYASEYIILPSFRSILVKPC